MSMKNTDANLVLRKKFCTSMEWRLSVSVRAEIYQNTLRFLSYYALSMSVRDRRKMLIVTSYSDFEKRMRIERFISTPISQIVADISRVL